MPGNKVGVLSLPPVRPDCYLPLLLLCCLVACPFQALPHTAVANMIRASFFLLRRVSQRYGCPSGARTSWSSSKPHSPSYLRCPILVQTAAALAMVLLIGRSTGR